MSNKESWARRITTCEQSLLLSSCWSRGRRGGSTWIASRLWSRHSLSLQASSPGALAAGREKEGQLATASLEFECLHRKSRCEMLIGGDDISNDVITFGTCFQCLFTFALISASRWLAEIWQYSRRGAAGEMEVEFKFQRRSCKLSLLFPPRHQSTPDTLLASYRSLNFWTIVNLVFSRQSGFSSASIRLLISRWS